MNIAALAKDLLGVVKTHTAQMTPAQQAQAGNILQKVFGFIIQVFTTGSGDLDLKDSETFPFLGKSYTFDENLHVTASSV